MSLLRDLESLGSLLDTDPGFRRRLDDEDVADEGTVLPKEPIELITRPDENEEDGGRLISSTSDPDDGVESVGEPGSIGEFIVVLAVQVLALGRFNNFDRC